MNNWTYISVITTTLNDQNHISENCIGSVIFIFYFDWSPICLHGEGGVYDLYCSQPPGAIKEPAASLLRTSETHPVQRCILQILVVTSGYLSYCCLSIISNQSAHSPLTSDINKAFSSTQLPLTGYFLFFGPFSVNPRDGCVWKSQ